MVSVHTDTNAPRAHALRHTHTHVRLKRRYDKYPILGVPWGQNDKVDLARFLPIVRRGELSVIRKYMVADPMSPQGCVWKNIQLCTLTAGALFFDQSALGVLSKTSADGTKTNSKETFKRGCTLVAASGPVEVMWIGRRQIHELCQADADVASKLRRSVLPYPSTAEVHQLLEDQGHWKGFKEQLVEEEALASPRARAHAIELRASAVGSGSGRNSTVRSPRSLTTQPTHNHVRTLPPHSVA